jgi:hypothetical protein
MIASLKSVLTAGVAVAALGLSAFAAPITVSSTVDQSGYLGGQNLPTYPLTGDPVTGLGGGFDFSGQGANGITSIDSLTITVASINDGDTGTGDYDFNNLFLGLNGVNTGIALNGLLNGQIASVSVTGAPNAASTTALLAALQAGTPISGSIIDISPANGTPAGDILGISRLGQATLTINGQTSVVGVPVPAAAFLAPLGAVGAGIYARRFRRAK